MSKRFLSWVPLIFFILLENLHNHNISDTQQFKDEDALKVILAEILQSQSPYYEILKKDFNDDGIPEILLFIGKKSSHPNVEFIPTFMVFAYQGSKWLKVSELEIDLIGSIARFATEYHLHVITLNKDCGGETLVFIPTAECASCNEFSVIRITNKLVLQNLGNYPNAYAIAADVTTGLYEDPNCRKQE